jgi:chromosome transmission fidelity protein 1
MVGLPYPNPSDPELQERMKFADHSAKINDCTNLDGREYYTNLCMKAVNQCIGRAIRHINDYACILLVDQRYSVALESSNSPISTKLPGWIKKSLNSVQTFGQAQSRIAQFFKVMGNIP